MPEKPNLADMLATTAGSTRRKAQPAPNGAPRQANSREGHQLLGSHVPEEAKHQFDMLATEQKKTKENLHAEAINDLFAKYGKPEICPIRPRGRRKREEGQG